MIHYGYYADVPDDAVEDLLGSSRMCRFVTMGKDVPHLGLYPFTHDAAGFDIHLHREDEQIADLRERPSCLLEVDEVLSTIPSHWVDPENAVFATAYHRTVSFECTAVLTSDPAAIVRQQSLIMKRYQPEGGHLPVADDATYADLLRMLVGVRLEIRTKKIKFKLAQNRDMETRKKIVARLRERGTELDRRTADLISWTIDLGWTTRGRA